MKFLATAISLAGHIGATSVAMAQTPDYLVQNRACSKQRTTCSRCGGGSYGTGARSCGTATGGPVGGISGRN